MGYKGLTATYTVTVVGVESISIDQAPATAKQGLDIDRSGLRITASYGDKIAPRVVPGDEVTISDYNKDTTGAQTVTAEYYGKTAPFSVTVAALIGLKITKPPVKASYFSGEPLDLTGLEVTGTWQGAGDAPVTPEYVSGFDTGVQGPQTVIVEALGKQLSLTVTVKEPSDPARWTPISSVFAKNIIHVVYGNGKFVVAGYPDDKNEGYVSDKLNQSIILYSTDGSAWTKASVPENYKNRRIVFGNGRFVTIGTFEYLQTGTQQWTISYYQVESSDGINWSDRDVLLASTTQETQAMNAVLGSIRYIFFDGSRFIALRSGTGLAPFSYLYSTNNGKSWKQGEGTIAIDNRPITAVVSGNGRLIGVGLDAIGWSTDGTIWTDADQQGESGGNLHAVAYGFGMFVAVGNGGNIIYSRDGYTWTKVASSTSGSSDIYHLAYGDGKFVAIGTNGRIAYSNRVD